MITRELRSTLNLAMQTAQRKRHEYLTLEHVLYAMLKDPVATEILQACGGDLVALKRSLDEFIDDSIAQLPEGVDDAPEQTLAFQRALQRAALHVQSSGKKQMDAGNLLAAMYRESDSHAIFLLEQQGVTRLDVLNYISHGIRKVGDGDGDGDAGGGGQQAEGGGKKKDPLESFCTELVAEAAAGRLDPLIGRATEITRTVHVLARRRKNNPLFIGEPGVGKTALVEGLARRIHDDDVPEFLKGARIYAMDMGGMLAGTKFRGDFEERFKGILERLKDDEKALLFIDEIHTVVGAGATTGGHMDAGNMLKPALASGKLRCLGSTTHQEYRRSIEKDRALARRFQRINVMEPSVDETIAILNGLKSRYEEHHSVTYTDDAIDAAARLAGKHLRDKHLPDKAIDVIDEAGAEVQLKVDESEVKVEHVENTIARIAGVPARSVSSSEKVQLSDLDSRLKAVIFGQDSAIDKVVAAVKLSRAGLGTPEKPVGSFLFCGPTGVGKTELAKQLAFALGIEFIRFDMSEYMEKHTVSRLIGAPPGYVGYDQGGQLTDAVVKNPYSVILLDEIEKAHADLFNVLLQIMDHATLTDNQGRKADFRNVVLIMTSNVGAREISKGGLGFVEGVASDRGGAALERTFSPEFRNRLDATVWFESLPRKAILRVVDKFVMELEGQLADRDITLDLTEPAREWLGDAGYDPKFGARPMARTIHTHIKRPLADEILCGRLASGGRVVVDLDPDAEGDDKKQKGKIIFRVPDAPEPAPEDDEAPATV